MPEALQAFYAVTTSDSSTSLYKVSITEAGLLEVLKIKLSGASHVEAGQKLGVGNNFLGITLEGLYSYQALGRVRPADVDYIVTNKHTSAIAGLFLTEDKAEECFGSKLLDKWDARWTSETKSTLRAIGDGHPSFILDLLVLAM